MSVLECEQLDTEARLVYLTNFLSEQLSKGIPKNRGSRETGRYPVAAVHKLLQAKFLKPFEIKVP